MALQVRGFEALMLRAQGASVDSPKAVADEDEWIL